MSIVVLLDFLWAADVLVCPDVEVQVNLLTGCQINVRRIVSMGKNLKEQSTEDLKRKLKIGRVVLTICWSAVLVSVIITFYVGDSSAIRATSAGFMGLGVVTIAMLIGEKKIKEEISRRGD